MQSRAEIRVPIAPGELFDKIAILEIKRGRITDAKKRANVDHELVLLRQARDAAINTSSALQELSQQLRSVNEALWDIEDEIRRHERDGDFGARFVELARSVYQTNDRRARLKRQVNELLGSAIVEEKEYVDYQPGAGAQ